MPPGRGCAPHHHRVLLRFVRRVRGAELWELRDGEVKAWGAAPPAWIHGGAAAPPGGMGGNGALMALPFFFFFFWGGGAGKSQV